MDFTKINQILGALGRRNDLVLAVFIVAIIFMMILPLPTMLVDFLIALNMGTAVILLMMAVYIKSPLEFSSFPSVLLIATLFRLALSISTTRLILLDADAGQIIFTFGDFIVGGNFIVGCVIFLILTIVQFIVITKGSERVAEVSARFSLDSMPGKQMSIDGDLRAGSIDGEEAQRRRSAVQKESQLYGSMDGAMKFVKGDAIAGIIIILVNIIGGIAIGMTQENMAAGEAMEVYSILTIGDGLVAQIPALFISITAGFIVTRVTAEESENLGMDIGTQVTKHPKALLVGGALLIGFSLIPGFPTLTFLGLAGLIGGGGYWITRRSKAGAVKGSGGDFMSAASSAVSKGKSSGGAGKEEDFSLLSPLVVETHSDIKKHVDMSQFNNGLAKVREALYMDLGVPFPGVHLRFNDSVTSKHYKILLHEVPVIEGELPTKHVLVREAPEHLDILSIPYLKRDESFPGNPLWVERSYITMLKEADVDFMELDKVLCFHLVHILKRHAEEFIGIQETRHLIDQMESSFGELTKEVQRLLPLQKITEIFQRLVSEDISIRDLRSIFEALVEWAQKEKDVVLLAEYVRGNLSRQISYKYSNGQNILPAYLLDQDAEEVVRGGIRQTSSGAYLALDPEVTNQFIENIKESVGDIASAQSKPVLVVSMDIRRYIRKLIEMDLYDLAVLSFQELSREINIQPLSRISIH